METGLCRVLPLLLPRLSGEIGGDDRQYILKQKSISTFQIKLQEKSEVTVVFF